MLQAALSLVLWIPPVLAGGFDTDPPTDTDDTDPFVEADTDADSDSDSDSDTDSDTDSDSDDDTDAGVDAGGTATDLAGEEGGSPWGEGDCGCATPASGRAAIALAPLVLALARRRSTRHVGKT